MNKIRVPDGGGSKSRINLGRADSRSNSNSLFIALFRLRGISCFCFDLPFSLFGRSVLKEMFQAPSPPLVPPNVHAKYGAGGQGERSTINKIIRSCASYNSNSCVSSPVRSLGDLSTGGDCPPPSKCPPPQQLLHTLCTQKALTSGIGGRTPPFSDWTLSSP